MNIPSNGYSVGNLSTTTISGTVPYRNNTPVRNGQIKLYTVTDYGTQEEQRTLIFTWFLKDCTIYNNSSVTFTGVDAMAFASNNYAIGKDAQSRADTIGVRFNVAATTISSLCGATVTIDPSSSSTVNNMRPALDENKTTDSVKNLMEMVARFDCVNYYTECTLNSIRLTRTSGSETTVTDSDYSPLTIGISSNTIAGVRVKNDKSVVFAPTPINLKKMELRIPIPEDYGIYEFGNLGSRADTMEINTPIINADMPMTQFSALVGKPFGTQFSCANIKVPYNELFIPMTKINFPNDNRAYYIANADYRLTSLGIYASISGTARAVSDYEYIGATERQLRDKVAMEYNYGGTCLTQDGLQFKAVTAITQVDSSNDVTLGHKEIYGVVPLGKGLFGLGNDIVCSQPLISKDTSHKDDTPIHKVTYEYEDFYIDIAWTETTQGKMEDIQWLRRWKTS